MANDRVPTPDRSLHRRRRPLAGEDLADALVGHDASGRPTLTAPDASHRGSRSTLIFLYAFQTAGPDSLNQ